MQYSVSEDTLVDAAFFFVDNNSTIRDTAEHFGIPKSTLCRMFNNRLSSINSALYLEVRKQLDFNKDSAPSRGGVSKNNS